ncbi:NodT family efflux transporter outer membrane factor (OMF) lipoprotein [Paraburkholderia sp. GAS33]|jgi:NodT family efflux transporter outer membrane factor (OMF) lipoprotein|uniref:efflux transporter outer membrane subunit n=1 Tax=Paraburkholderia sp. GAS33 TaxID=3035130 RepID=UPI003D1C9317
MAHSLSIRPVLLALLSGAMLAGCTLGPNFQRPNVSAPNDFTRANQAEAPSRPVEATLAPEWWSLLGDSDLVALESRLATDNLDVKAASVRLLESRAGLRIAGAELYPTLSGAASYDRERASPNGIFSLLGTTPAGVQPESANGETAFGVSSLPGSSGSPPYNLWQYGFDASYELDLWGHARRGVEAANAAVQASAEERRAVLLSAQAELARDYIELRATQTLLDITNQNLALANSTVKLTRLRMTEGATTPLDVANASAQVASIEARLPPLQARRDALINALSFLLGEQPGALAQMLGAPRDIPSLPARAPIGFPSELVRRRPDIRRAEAQLHAATAEIGVAQADFYPQISLTGSLGSQSLQLSSLGDWASHQFVFGPSISMPIFQGGRLRGTLQLRKAQQQEAAIGFQRTVLQAWHEVDDALSAYDAEQRRRDNLKEVVQQDQLGLSVAQQRYREGAIDFLNVLAVQKDLLAAQSELAQSQADAAVNLVTLYKALGGGWETAFPEDASSTAEHTGSTPLKTVSTATGASAPQ